MNCFFILLLYFFVQARCDPDFQNPKGPDTMSSDKNQSVQVGVKADILASVRQYPSQLHKCTATFIAPNALLTTAKCLYCEDCQLLVHAFSSTLTDESQTSKGVSYVIQKAVIHPDYEKAPEQNNVGLIQLASKIPKAVVFSLQASVPDISGLIVETYRWQFTTNYREFNLERVKEQTISNAACSAFFEKYIDYKHVCTRRNDSVLLGQFDQGVPIIDKSTGTGTIVGIYETEGKVHPSKIETYQAIFPFVPWIKRILACNFNCTSSGMNETTPLPKSVPSFATTRTIPSLFTEIPSSDNSTSPTFPSVPELNEGGKTEEAEPEKKTPNATGDDSNQRNKPLWSTELPFFDEKQTTFKPKPFRGKRFT